MGLEAQAQREGVGNIAGASGAVVGLLLLFIHKGDVTNSSTENEKHEDVQKRVFTGLIEICRAALDGRNFKIGGRIDSNIDLNIDSVSTNGDIGI